jgi:hypothetical protein
MNLRIAIILGAAFIAGCLAIGGVYSEVSAMTGSVAGGSSYVLNRFTGTVSFCTATYCRTLREAPKLAVAVGQ